MFPSKDEMEKICSNFNWCVENDFQVTIRPVDCGYDNFGKYYSTKEHQIHIRKGGITTEGKDFIYKDGVKFNSKVTVGNKIYKDSTEAAVACWDVYAKLRERYG